MVDSLFQDFDFSLLDTPEFKEDAVREELIVPLLKHLGYSASDEHRIVRSKSLIHPYVYIGTQKKKIYIIPDYLLQFRRENFWILDAKAPSEEITKGKNVEQAFSYAIHKDIRVKYYALCNGRKFVLFHVSKWPPILEGELSNISKWLLVLEKLLSVKNASKSDPTRKIKPDFGLYLLKSGLAFSKDGSKINHLFTNLPIMAISRLEEKKYSLSSIIAGFDDTALMATFDFEEELYKKFLTVIPEKQQKEVSEALSRQPFTHLFYDGSCSVGIASRIGDIIHTNEDESYCPLETFEFL